MARVLVTHEFSGIVRDAFRAGGHDAWSCDLIPTESDPLYHEQCDAREAISAGSPWDLIIMHPECRYMALCGNATWAGTLEREEALTDACDLWAFARDHAPRVCMENPQSVLFPALRTGGVVVQYIQPYEYGHPETKKTGLALHNLPKLVPTDNVRAEMEALPPHIRHKVWYASPGPDRSKNRSRFFVGVAEAMNAQWGSLL